MSIGTAFLWCIVFWLAFAALVFLVVA